MTGSPQPMQVTRRRGAKRGDHGTYVVAAAGETTTTAIDKCRPAAGPQADDRRRGRRQSRL